MDTFSAYCDCIAHTQQKKGQAAQAGIRPMKTLSLHPPRALACAAAAVSAGVLACAGVQAQEDEDRIAASREMSDLIQGPLRAELDAPRPAAPPAMRLSAPSSAYTLRFAPRLRPAAPDTHSAAPAAASFAGALLTARASDVITRDGLAAFAGQPALLAETPSGGRLSMSISEGWAPNIARLGFDADYAETAGRALNPALLPDHRNMAVSYEGFFDSPGGADGLDVGLSPRAGLALGDDGTAARAGATVRFGRYLGELENDRPAWWFFAGADRQALLYDPGQGFDVRDALVMQPYAMVGDAQAGVAVRVGATDVSLAYVHRETRYSLPQEGWETSEGFAAFSLTWKR